MVKGLLFDYGGTLDTNGRHWATVIWDAYQKQQVQVSKKLFSKAYAHGERMMALKPLVKLEHTFLDVMVLKLEQQFEYLSDNGVEVRRGDIMDIAMMCEDIARNTVHFAEIVLNKLQASHPMVVVSNFYGNLKTVLDDFGILHFFDHVIESAVVGVRKPDAEIYRLGVEALRCPPDKCVVIGDSYGKDMIPGKKAGCKTVWLNVDGWGESGIDEYKVVDVEIDDLAKVPGAIDKLIKNNG
jgi:haloacid dehalogenase superfamily, subfamily IA, variant 3 with third motif having DD or ED/haloacid dehalogenase superfamily, subfamily IA, variant 1 with third motif having Dx(3-4)D or Dx(3-4)E